MREGCRPLRALFAPRRSGVKWSLENRRRLSSMTKSHIVWVLYITLYHVMHLWDGLKWVMFPWITSNCPKDVSIRWILWEWPRHGPLSQNLTNFFDFLGPMDEWLLFANTILFTSMYVIIFVDIKGSHIWKPLLSSWKSGYNVHYTVLCGMKSGRIYFHAVKHEKLTVWI